MEKNYVHDIYEKIAHDFDNTRFCHWGSVKNFLDNLDNYSIIGDIGCGNGKYMKYNPENKEYTYIGIDTCKNLLNILKNNNKNSDVILGNGLNIPFRDNSFDAIISVAVFHHIFHNCDRNKFIIELLRILKPGGKIHFTVWCDQLKKKNMEFLGNNDYFILWKNKYKRYYHLFNKEELEDLLSKIQNIKYDISYEMENWAVTIEKFI